MIQHRFWCLAFATIGILMSLLAVECYWLHIVSGYAACPLAALGAFAASFRAWLDWRKWGAMDRRGYSGDA